MWFPHRSCPKSTARTCPENDRDVTPARIAAGLHPQGAVDEIAAALEVERIRALVERDDEIPKYAEPYVTCVEAVGERAARGQHHLGLGVVDGEVGEVDPIERTRVRGRRPADAVGAPRRGDAGRNDAWMTIDERLIKKNLAGVAPVAQERHLERVVDAEARLGER